MAIDIRNNPQGYDANLEQDDNKSGSSALKEQVQNLQSAGKNMAENLEHTAYEAGQKAKDILIKGENISKEGIHYIEDQIKSYPLTSMAISAIIGMLLSKIISSNKH